MTSKERIQALLKNKSTDQIPVYHLQFSGDTASIILGRKACVGGGFTQFEALKAMWNGQEAYRQYLEQRRQDAIDLAMACSHDIIRLHYWDWPIEKWPVEHPTEHQFIVEHKGARMTIDYSPELELILERTDGGDLYWKEEGKEPDNLKREIAELEKQLSDTPPSLQADPDLKASIEEFPDHIVRCGAGVVSLGMEDSQSELMAALNWPDLMRTKLCLKAEILAAKVPSLAASGVEMTINSGDFCSVAGPFVSPETYRATVVPALRILVDACHKAGISYIYSSDGDFSSVADYAFHEAGIDGWCETDKSAGMELSWLRQTFPDKVFIGNIQSQVLHRGTPSEVREEVQACMRDAKDYGGIIVGVSNMIMPGTPAENIDILLTIIDQEKR